MKLIEIDGLDHYVYKVMAVLMEDKQQGYSKYIENLISFLIANKLKSQMFLKSMDIDLAFDAYIKSLQERSYDEELEFILLLAAWDIRAWRIIFDTENGLSSKCIKILESENQIPYKYFDDDKKVSVYLYKNKIIPLIDYYESDWSDSQSSEELLNDQEIKIDPNTPSIRSGIGSFTISQTDLVKTTSMVNKPLTSIMMPKPMYSNSYQNLTAFPFINPPEIWGSQKAKESNPENLTTSKTKKNK